MTNKKRTKKPIIIIIILLILVGSSYFLYRQGYLDEPINFILNKLNIDTTKYPEGYEFPSITIKDEYSKGILHSSDKNFNAKDYFDLKAYNDNYKVKFELVDESIYDIKKEGTHKVIITIEDDLGNASSLETLVYTTPSNKDTIIDSDELQKYLDAIANQTQENNPDTDKKDETDKEPEIEVEPPTSKKGHYETILVKEAYDEVIPAHDEEVLVKAAYTEAVLVTPAWDETISYCSLYGPDEEFRYICTGCGAQYPELKSIQEHVVTTSGCGSYSGQYVPVSDPYCKEYDSYIEHHDAAYDYIYHDAEYKTVHYDEKIIHHPAQYKKVWVED